MARLLPKLLKTLSYASCLLALLPGLPASAQSSVVAFSPTGTVKGVRQVHARFSAQMVPFGDPRPADPFTIDCPEKGSGRWADGKNWSYDFERDLPAGVVCRFILQAGLKDLAGQNVTGDAAYRFSTGGPAIVDAIPRDGHSAIDENQVFMLGLDAVADEASIAAHAYCRADGINEKIGVRLLQGKEREQAMAIRKNFVDRYLIIYFKARGIEWKAGLPLKSHGAQALPLSVLQCKRSFPANTKVTLVWDAGIATESGVASDQAQTLSFKTRPDFTAKWSCERANAKAQCIPFLPVRLDFSAPVKADDARAMTLTSSKGVKFKPVIGKSDERAEYVSSIGFEGPLPESTSFTLSLPAKLKDDAGRALMNQSRFPMTVRTDEAPPLVKFPASFGILEARGDRLLPVTVRSVEANLAASKVALPTSGETAANMVEGNLVEGNALRLPDNEDLAIIAWMKRLSGNGQWAPGEQYNDSLAKPVLSGKADKGVVSKFALPKPRGARAFEVIGIPLPKPGFYVVELASPKLGRVLLNKPQTAYVHTAALVTNLAAHFKHGAASSLVWVTSLDNGTPVPRATVIVRDCSGKALWQGVTDSSGIARIGQELTTADCKGNRALFVSARSNGDMTFTLSDWVGGIEAWRYGLPTSDARADNTLLASVFDRTLLRAGETVHMKHFVRRHTAGGIALVAAGNGVAGAAKVVITHQGSEQQFELPLRWSGNGTAENDWVIPADAKQGVYSVSMAGVESGTFRVEAFRVPSMKAMLQGPKTPAVQASAVQLDAQLNYLSGGAAGDAPVKLRSVVQNRVVSFADYDEYTFSNGDVKEGLVKQTPWFAEDEDNFGEDGQGQDGAALGAARTQNLNLDKAGGARFTIDKLPASPLPMDLMAELAYQDANGETLSVATRVPLWPAKNVIGIQPAGWSMPRDDYKFSVVVLATDGKPAPGVQVAVDFFQRKTYSHRRRLIGGFYSYESTNEIIKLGSACEGKTDARGLLACAVKAPASGELILRAASVDADGRPVVAHRETLVAGSDETVFGGSDNDRIDVLAEKKRYEPGESASLQVRMPFRSGTALVTVEREGILDTFVRQLDGNAPTLEIPVKASYAPNVYVSVLVVRGRVAGVQPTALVDLGKPAYKMGIAALKVGWQAHELKVQVTPDREVYKTRDKAQVKVKVVRADGQPLPAGAEVALAAVDVGLLELMPNDSWNLLDTMMQQRSLQVETSTAQMQVIGKRHFGRKAFPHGGGGGKGASRELFDTLLFWKGTVKLDANGEASVQVPLNDSLTSFRIVAIASAGSSLFGTGKVDIRSTQDLIVLSGLPALVREGDQFRAGFTVRNTSAAPLKTTLDANVKGQSLARQNVTLAAGEAREVYWNYTVPAGIKELVWDVTAKADGAGDKLKVTQKVTYAVPLRTYQATLLQLDKPQLMSVQMPDGALPGRGGIQTTLVARLGSDLPGVRDYMSAYPYTCFEQNTSKAIALGDSALWSRTVASLPAYLDSDGLLKYFPAMQSGSDTLTAYVLSATAEAGYVIPAQTKNKMEEALSAFVHGRIARHSAINSSDLAVRKLAALEALSRSNKVAPDSFESIAIEPNLWPTSAVIDWYLVLRRTPALARRDAALAEAQQILRARLNFQGTTMGFSTERKDNWWWLMVSGDVNANRLLLAVLDNPEWKDDIGRLVRGTLGRQQKGRWNTTVANAWGTLAIRKFSEQFESVAVTGNANVVLGDKKWSGPVPGTVLQAWPKGAAQLNLSMSPGSTGKPWATVQSVAAILLKAPLSSGYKVVKTITPVEQKTAGAWSRGDVYRVRLDLEAQADMGWVVVDDPIPASASVLGTGLGRDSQLLTGGEKRTGAVWPAYEERTFEAFRAYYEYVPKGKWSVEYTVRLNNSGEFNLPATRIEAMYAPEMFGENPNGAVKVAQ